MVDNVQTCNVSSLSDTEPDQVPQRHHSEHAIFRMHGEHRLSASKQGVELAHCDGCGQTSHVSRQATQSQSTWTTDGTVTEDSDTSMVLTLDSVCVCV